MCGKSRKLIRIDHQALWVSLETWRKELCEVTVGRSPGQPLLSQRCVPTPHLAVNCQLQPMVFLQTGNWRREGKGCPFPGTLGAPRDLNLGYLTQVFAFKGQSRPGNLGIL